MVNENEKNDIQDLIEDSPISDGMDTSGIMDQLVSTDSRQVKRCKYPTCNNDIAADSQFEYCEKCRAIAARNGVALCIDPCAPNELERRYEVTQTLLHNLTGEEILKTAQRIEHIYLEFQKTIKLHNLEQGIKKVFKPIAEVVEEQRARNEAASSSERKLRAKADRGKKQRVDRIDKLKTLLGTDDTDAVKKFMDEEIDL